MSILKRLLWTATGIAAGHITGQLLGETQEEKQKLSRNGRLIGGLSGFGLSFLTDEPKDTVNYKLKHRGKLVYHGITKEHRLDNRIYEHETSGKNFNEIIYDFPKTRTEAMNLERFRIKRHKPKYNIQHNC